MKLKSFNDPIIFSTKRFLNSNNKEKTIKKDAEIWKKYDKEGLRYRLKILEDLKGEL